MKKLICFILGILFCFITACDIAEKKNLFSGCLESTYNIEMEEQISQRYYTFSDSLIIERIPCSSRLTEYPDKVCALEMWDGEKWRTIHVEAEDESYATIEKRLLNVNLEKAWQNYGCGLYRIVSSGIGASDGEVIYFSNEIEVLDWECVVDGDNLMALFDGTPILEQTILVKGTETAEVNNEQIQKLVESIVDLKCVDVREKNSSVGPDSTGYKLTIILDNGIVLSIREQRGKTEEDIEYSAVCTWQGLGVEILLHNEKWAWCESVRSIVGEVE